MTYHDAFHMARQACRDLRQRIYLLHDPQGCDGPESEAYEWGDSIARVYLYTHARVIATFTPLPGDKIEVTPVARPSA